ncbi:MAG: bile acid:sodium symporter [Herbaspirillum sp.]|jgi:sodium/bile acid cotransporter 7|nr:bile acid:sodium symporter [Herbaspirillum sp.]
MARFRFLPDSMSMMLLTVLVAASFFPATGSIAVDLNSVTVLMIGLLFFLHGARLSRAALMAGATHWRLHLAVLCCTFVMFPLMGLVLKPALLKVLTPELYVGILFLCTLPSTVQSSIAFTSAARGNVPAAICSASASNLLGIFVTPVLVGLMVISSAGSQASPDAVLKIIYQLLLPFIAGQVLRQWIGAWVDRNKGLLKVVDQGSILLVVYAAFSEAVEQGLWHQLPLIKILSLVTVCGAMLALVMGGMSWLCRRIGFSKEDEITIVFCGSKKSLAFGVAMAKVLMAGSAISMILLPIMLFHQIQLLVCAMMAGRYAKRKEIAVPGLTAAVELRS